jgi:retron-type reverse transcriptase
MKEAVGGKVSGHLNERMAAMAHFVNFANQSNTFNGGMEGSNNYSLFCSLVNQFGFRQSHSTCHAVNLFVSLIQEALKKNKHVIGIFVDLSKAFDTIYHKILLKKLERYGIGGVANLLIESYLSRRVQYTHVLGEKSDALTTQYGVPKGSVLGPLLFLLYMNDIYRLFNLGAYVLFADDTNIFVEGATAKETYEKSNELLKCLCKYMIGRG